MGEWKRPELKPRMGTNLKPQLDFHGITHRWAAIYGKFIYIYVIKSSPALPAKVKVQRLLHEMTYDLSVLRDPPLFVAPILLCFPFLLLCLGCT